MNCSYLVNDSWYLAYPYPTDPDSTTLPNLYIAQAAVLSVVSIELYWDGVEYCLYLSKVSVERKLTF